MSNKSFFKSSIALSLLSCLLFSCMSPVDSKLEKTISPQTLDSKKPEAYVNSDGASSSNSSGKLSAPAAAPRDSYAMPAAPSASSSSSGGSSYAPSEVVSDSPSSSIAKKEKALAAGAAAPAIVSGDTVSNSETGASVSIKPQPEYKQLSAGDKDDNANFDEYLDYLKKNATKLTEGKDILKVDVSKRFIISVTDKNKKSIQDAKVTITANGSTVFNGKSYANGKTIFHPLATTSSKDCQQQTCGLADTYKVTVEKNGDKLTKEFTPSEKEWNFQFDTNRTLSQQANLDITFLVDATGSMGDEINSIQKTIKDISAKIKDLSSNPKIRFSLVSYKDRGDTYRVKRYDFTNNLTFFQEILDELSAGGGGDYPEAMNEGLFHAVSKVSWNNSEDATRLVFLIADAPPQLKYSDDVKYTESMQEAVKNGIKIYPIAASGLDSAGEYVFRQLAQNTLAKFLFITYGGDAQTAGTTPHDVGEFKENNLDSLVVNIVKEELSNLN